MIGSWYLVAWIAWSCPGGMLARFVPEPVKPLICRPARTESLMFMQRSDAMTKVQELGPYAIPTLHWCQTGRCYTRGIDWNLVAVQK
jgi:hypothetical protein